MLEEEADSSGGSAAPGLEEPLLSAADMAGSPKPVSFMLRHSTVCCTFYCLLTRAVLAERSPTWTRVEQAGCVGQLAQGASERERG